MIDFTLQAYQAYLELIKVKFPAILRIDEFMEAEERPDSFCIFRHDVDRRAGHSLAMARLEAEMGIRSTYYFRTRSHTLRPDLIREVSGLGHEIGYHYENLSDSRGDMAAALADFEIQLARLREIVPVRTIAMHGSALQGIDNRDLWRDPVNHAMLRSKFDLLGEAYLDIDYRDICYLTDTGRNWTSNKSNIRDKVDSNVHADFESREALMAYLSGSPHPRMVFQIHPERFSPTKRDLPIDWGRDKAANIAKVLFRMLR